MSLKKYFRNKFRTQNFWKITGWFVYGIVGITALISLIWAIIKIVQGSFYATMGFFGSVGFFILVIGGLNWFVKFLFGKDIFLN